MGSSDAPVIMGVSPYKTPYQLWEEKTGRSKYEPKNKWILEKGHQNEEIARAIYETRFTKEATPQCFIHDNYYYIRASLDGWIVEDKKAIEIKYQGREAHLKTLKEGKIPEKYMWQLVHQFLVTGCKEIDFLSYNDEHDDIPEALAVVTIKRKENLVERLLFVAKEFWKLVLNDKPPRLNDADFKMV